MKYRVKEIISKSKYKSEILAASIRNTRQLREVAIAGADIATLPISVLQDLVKNTKNLFFRNVYLGNTSFFQTNVENFNFKNVSFRKFPCEKLNWFKKKISIHRTGVKDEIWNDENSEGVTGAGGDQGHKHEGGYDVPPVIDAGLVFDGAIHLVA